MNSRLLASSGSVVSALASSACCWLPLIVMGVGLSAAGMATFFERFRPVFLIAAILLLAVGFYLNYFRKDRCAPGAACERPNPQLRRMNRVMLWISTALVVTFALFPSYVGALFGVQSISAELATESTAAWTITIDGMTCAGCEVAVNQSLAEVPGVLHATASYDNANAAITVDAGNPPTHMALVAAVGKAGYALVSLSTSQVVTEPALAGQWVTELEEQNGEIIKRVMDLGVLNGKWVGEFDLPKYNVMNYPVEIKSAEGEIELFLTAIGMSFEGTIDADGALVGVGQSEGQENEPISFRRTGAAEFSDGFLELEAAADNASLDMLSENGSQLQQRFNDDVKKTRLLMLLSPT